MSIALATTWNPRGEEQRFFKLLPQLAEIYSCLVVVMPPKTPPEFLEFFDEISGLQSAEGGQDSPFKGLIQALISPHWPWGRYLALQKALESQSSHIQYADFDRLLRWVETRPAEWQRTVDAIQCYDCLIVGRTPAAYQTHPQALVQTEAISNRVVSDLLGRPMDVSAGSKGFSRRAASFLVANTNPGHAIGTDGEWPVLLHRAGFAVEYVEVDGLDWESADRYQESAADSHRQRSAAEAYDADPHNWAWRVEIASEIVQCALEAQERNLPSMHQPDSIHPQFDFDAVFEVDDYMYFYSDMLSDETTERQVAFLVQELGLNSPRKILDLACGFGRHANRLAALGHSVTGVDLMEGFLKLARQDAVARGVSVDYRQGDMRRIVYGEWVPSHEEFDLVLLLFTAFGYFDDADNLLVLQNISRALKPGGFLVFDIQNRDMFLHGFKPFNVTEKSGDLMIDRQTFDSETGQLYNRRIVIRNGVRKDKPFSIRLYNPTEIRELLKQAGLDLFRMYGGWDALPISIDSRRMVIIAQKL